MLVGMTVLGLTPLTWVILVPAVGCWPAAGYLVYRINRSAKRHEEHADHERERLLAAHAQSVAAAGEPDVPGA